jgi:serine/threonine protein phosphatase PrpC
MHLKGYSCSVVGSREMNQDSLLIDDVRKLYAVADGVGGGLNGEVASKMAVDGVAKGFSDPIKFASLFQTLQTSILNEALNTFGEPVMGTTLTAAHVRDNDLYICHVGDSRCYLFDNSQLRQLTEDQEFYDENVQATVLCSYLGLPPELQTMKILEEKVPVKAGQRFLLCSDGLYRQMTESRMVALIREMGAEPDKLVARFCEEAAQKNHSDNVTVVYVEMNE